jgi:hypothetical protein
MKLPKFALVSDKQRETDRKDRAFIAQSVTCPEKRRQLLGQLKTSTGRAKIAKLAVRSAVVYAPYIAAAGVAAAALRSSVRQK